MESFIEINNDNNSSMLINPENLNKSFNNYLPQKPNELRNQRCKADNKTHYSTKETKYNVVSNINSSFQKTFSLFNESNCDSNSQTDRSSNNLKEIKVNVPSKPKKNNSNLIDNHSLINNENNLKDLNSLNMNYQDKDKLKKISRIQKWWKYTYKIIFIQKYIRKFLVRKNMTNMIYFIKYSFKLLFKLVMYNIKINIKGKNNHNINGNIAYLNNTEAKKNNNKKIKKMGTSTKFSKNMKLNNHPSFNAASILNLNKKNDESKKLVNKKTKNEILKKFGTNNPININKTSTQLYSTHVNLCANKNKQGKTAKNKKEKKINTNKDKIIANNIFNIYNNVKKYYENENNNNSNNNLYDPNYSTATNFYTKNSKNPITSKPNKNKLKKMVTRGSMKNINEKIIINKNNNINVNININNNPKTDRSNRNDNNNSPNKNGVDSILYLLKLKKAFLFWHSYIIKKKIIQRLKFIKNIQTPNVKKTFSIYTINKTEKEKEVSITTKKINLSNSLMNLKNNKITPQKLKMKNNTKKNLTKNHYYTKKINKHSNSVENNNSMMNINIPNSSLNCSFNFEKENVFPNRNKNRNEFSNNGFNNSVIVVSQYDRNTEIKKKENNKNENITNNNSINETKRAYYFYAIINLIDKHNKRKKIKKYFYTWKHLSRYSKSFINNNGIEEKIISFKSLKTPFKNNFNNNNINKHNLLQQNNNFANFNCQTEASKDVFGNSKANSILMQKDLMTSNPLEKSVHPNLFKSNIKSSKIVYQKKLLVPTKIRNQSMHAININENEEDRNMTLIDNKRELNFMNQTIGNNFYNINTYINKNNCLNISQYIPKKNDFENENTKLQEGRINKVHTIEETEVYFTPSQTQNHTLTNSFIIGKNINREDGYNNNKINVNVIENYRKIVGNKENRENNRNIITINKGGIETKQIHLGEKNRKSNSHSQEFRNVNQSF